MYLSIQVNMEGQCTAPFTRMTQPAIDTNQVTARGLHLTAATFQMGVPWLPRSCESQTLVLAV